MATTDYATVLEQARQLTPEERRRLAEELVHEAGTFHTVHASDEAHVSLDEQAEIEAWFAKTDRIAAAVSAAWNDDMSAADAVKEQRRDL